MVDGIGRMAQESLRYMQRLDAVANNMANIDTPGFKGRKIFSAADSATDAPMQDQIFIDYSQGPITETGNVLDCAINGEGFFAVETKEGIAYTRDGRFSISSEGELMTQSGEFVMGGSGRIVVKGDKASINDKGIVAVDGNQVDTLKIVLFEAPQKLLSKGAGLFYDVQGEAKPRDIENVEVKAGHLEGANIQAVKEMIEMINIQRSFESYQKIIQTISEQDKLSTGRIGRLE
ncbi:MAG: flagellar basal-body rod protein FlgF [Deltaproteobacteria bacterium]|nr:flagellar basal-body rod protein FlgF [Deltaproteobacteria bacterium]